MIDIVIDEQFLLLAFIGCVSVIIAFLIVYTFTVRNRENDGPRITEVRYPQHPRNNSSRPPPSDEELSHSRGRQVEIFQQRLDGIQADHERGTISEDTYRRLDGEYREALNRLEGEDDADNGDDGGSGPEIVIGPGSIM